MGVFFNGALMNEKKSGLASQLCAEFYKEFCASKMRCDISNDFCFCQEAAAVADEFFKGLQFDKMIRDKHSRSVVVLPFKLE